MCVYAAPPVCRRFRQGSLINDPQRMGVWLLLSHLNSSSSSEGSVTLQKARCVEELVP